MSTLIRYTICESLVKIHRHEKLAIDETRKPYKMKGHSITYGHMWRVDTSKCVY